MSDSILQQLQQAAASALSSQTVAEGVQHLSRAFTLFSEETGRIKNAYSKLQERFQTVNQELKTKAVELQRLTHYLNNILRNVSDSILFIDLEGRITMANEPALKLFGFSSDQILAKNYWALFADDYFGFSIKEALKFGISQRLIYKSYPELQKELEISTTFVYEGPKPYHGLILFFRDVSETQKLQRVAQRNERLRELGEMTARVVHEIRNPLGGIRGYATLLYRDLEEDKHLQEMAGFVIEGTKALEKLVSTVLHYTRPVQLEPRSVEISSFLKQLIRFIKVDPGCPSNIQWDIHIPHDPFFAPIDPEKLKGALLNLIFNAFQAMPQGGKLTLSLLQRESTYQIAISDTGVGMDEELLKNLFSPFFTTKLKGTGLGLVETQKVIIAHYGMIDVRSQPNKGSTFTLTLPLKR